MQDDASSGEASLRPPRASRKSSAKLAFILVACLASLLAWTYERSLHPASIGVFPWLSPSLVLGLWIAYPDRAALRADLLRFLALFLLLFGGNAFVIKAFGMTPLLGPCAAAAALQLAALAPCVLLMRFATSALRRRLPSGRGSELVATLLGQLLPALLWLPIFLLSNAVHRAQGTVENQAAYMPHPGERIVFEGASGTPLVGLWFQHPAPKGAVLLVHGIGAEKVQFLPAVRVLVQRGYHVFTYDQRNHGESGGLSCTLGIVESEDLRRAWDLLRERTRGAPIRRVVMGISMGGAAAQLALPGLEDLDGLILDSTFARLEPIARRQIPLGPLSSGLLAIGHLFDLPVSGQHVLDVAPIAAVQGSSTPDNVLLLHARRDPLIPFSQAEELARAYGPRAHLCALDDNHHANGFIFDRARYEAAMNAFIDTLEAHSSKEKISWPHD